MGSQSKGSVAPKERVNITYTPATGDETAEVELPLKMLVIGDFTGREDSRSIEDRKPINIDKDNFADVLAEQEISIDISVEDRLSGEEGQEMAASLKFSSLKDFSPEGIVEQVPELAALMDLRNALTALKGPMGNIPAFRKKLAKMLESDENRAKLMAELGLGEEPTAAAAPEPTPSTDGPSDSGPADTDGPSDAPEGGDHE